LFPSPLRGRGWPKASEASRGRVRGSFYAKVLDHIQQYAARIREDVVIVVAQHGVALFGKPPVADEIASVACVLTTVGFYDHLVLQTDEIDDVSADQNLAPEFCIAETPVTEKEQQFPLGISRLAPKSTSAHAILGWM
jgi:hypothetical protein